jgi:hypothetical protein
MVWKGTTKVGFGVHDKYVIGWYCANKGEVTDAAKSRTNVGAVCFEHGYNKCYNALALKYVNKLRNNHDVAPLKMQEDAARAIQYQLSS